MQNLLFNDGNFGGAVVRLANLLIFCKKLNGFWHFSCGIFKKFNS